MGLAQSGIFLGKEKERKIKVCVEWGHGLCVLLISFARNSKGGGMEVVNSYLKRKKCKDSSLMVTCIGTRSVMSKTKQR